MTARLQRVLGPAPRAIDRAIRYLRIRQVRRHITDGRSVLDVGCSDGSLFVALADRISRGVGVDPRLMGSQHDGRFRYIADGFPTNALDSERFDVITMLAVLEHVPDEELPEWADACALLLAPHGIVIATVPDPRVDQLLHILIRLRLIAGMATHEHHGADPNAIPAVFADRGLTLRARRRFEFGLNNLFVFGQSEAGRS
jgi:2-polyprenyl-3-methyl-5-hydroxy-6-metoxy-1,4-benzoquinol methylase